MKKNASPLYQFILLFLSIYVLIALLVEAFWVTDSEIKRVLQYVDLFVCALFFMDFLAALKQAESKSKFMKWGWIDLVSSIPAIDPLRWGRLAKVVRILRYFRSIKSMRVVLQSLHASKLETLSLSVFLIMFVAFTISSAMILEFENSLASPITSAESAFWWSFLNLMNAKTIAGTAISQTGITLGIVLNKVGLLFFAYVNSLIIAWLIMARSTAAGADVTADE